MDPDQLVRALIPTDDMPRIPLYVNERRLNDVFQQRVSAVNEVLVTKGIGGEVSAGYLGILGGRLSRQKDVGTKIELTAVLRALLLEFEERENRRLIDLASERARSDAFLHFVGPARIFAPWESVSLPWPERSHHARWQVDADAMGVSNEAARAIQDRRERDQMWLGHGLSDVRRSPSTTSGETIVWIARGQQLVVAIASDAGIDRSGLRHYYTLPPFGILAMLGETDGEVAYLTPLWIWKETSERAWVCLPEG
jgi:hypothetical protein